ncbi:hypothetical protein [Halochromatium glycolicum]|uniref:Uncharacterized protein n=1 Tax=Halochromatium glycolicum TaxID=85075 RepID=A0AAJ0X8K2_9GAMM|nr:hypothetical protein [Halochromatium glycolicum]MBK1703143.1 hypothetical protein [Halochromatium glycolicum]
MLIGACAGGPQVSANERYTGQVAAGVVRPAGATGIAVQRRLISALEASGDFAGVYPLFAPTQSSEVGVVITPSILDERHGPNGLEQLRVQVRAERQSQTRDALKKTYSGRSSARNTALDDLIQPLARDLTRRYGRKPVY